MLQFLKKHKYKISYIFVVLVLLIPPLCINNYTVYALTEVSSIEKVLKYIFGNQMVKYIPGLTLALKSINCFFLLFFIFNKPIKKHFNIYVFVYMMFITLTQNIAWIDEYGLVISTGSLLLMLMTCIIWLVHIRKDKEDIKVNKKFLWMFIIVLLCIWYPLDKNAQFEFVLDPIQHYFSSSMYCFNFPVFVSFLLIFYKNNYGLFYELMALVGFIFGIIAVIVNFTYKTGMPNALMHIPLVVSSLTLFIHSWYVKYQIKKREKSRIICDEWF